MEFVRNGNDFEIGDIHKYYLVPSRTPDSPGVRRSLLHLAAEKNFADLLQLLISKGVSADVTDSEGVTPLILAAGQGCMQAVRALLESGADPGLGSPDGRLALHEALLFGHYETAEVLLGSGKVNVNLRFDDGLTALLMVLLIKNGADLTACCRVVCAYGPDLNICTPKVDNAIAGNGGSDRTRSTPYPYPSRSRKDAEEKGESVLDICLRRCLRMPEVFGIVTNLKTPREVSSEILNAVDGNLRSVLFRCLEAKCYDAARGLLFLGADPAIVPVAKPGKPLPDNCLIQVGYFIHVYILYVCVCVFVCLCVCVCMCVYVCMYVYVCVCMCVCMCVYVCVYIHIYVCVYLYFYICICACMCVYVCIYIYIYIYIYMCVCACFITILQTQRK